MRKMSYLAGWMRYGMRRKSRRCMSEFGRICKNTFHKLRQIHLKFWNKYILQFKTNTFHNLIWNEEKEKVVHVRICKNLHLHKREVLQLKNRKLEKKTVKLKNRKKSMSGFAWICSFHKMEVLQHRGRVAWFMFSARLSISLVHCDYNIPFS